MVMQSMRKGKSSGLIKFFFMTLLVLATGGLVLTDVGGFFRGGVANNDVAQVGSQNIPLASFDQKLRRTIARLGMTPEQAYQLGFMNQFLSTEVRNLLLQQAAQDKGIRVGRDIVAEQVSDMVAPMVQDGQTPQEVLDQILISQGMTESQFVHSLASEVAGRILLEAIATPVPGASNALGTYIYMHRNEMRDVELVHFPHAEIALEETPDDDMLMAFYERQKARYIIPEKRTIDLAMIKYDDLEDGVEMPEEELRDIYENEKENFLIPEKRSVEQVIVQSAADAEKIATQARDGASLKAALNNVTGSENGFIAAQDFAQADMLEEIAIPVFEATQTGAVIGPVETALGHYVVVLKDITPESQKSFEDIREDLNTEMVAIQLEDQKFDRLNLVEDLAAGGASLQEIALQVPLEITEISGVSAMGAPEALEPYGEDSRTIVQLTFEFSEGEISPVTDLGEDQKQYIVHVKAIAPQSFKPFETVKEELATLWTKEQKRQANREKIEALYQQLTDGEFEDLKALAIAEGAQVQSLEGIKRGAEAPAPLAQNAMSLAFALEKNNLSIIDTVDGFGIAQVTNVVLPPPNEDSTEALSEIQQSLKAEARNELTVLFLERQREKQGVNVNDGLLQRIYGNSEPSF